MATQHRGARRGNARRSKKDEFYTPLTGRGSVTEELKHYSRHFQGKHVYLPCDTRRSAFWIYLSDRFEDLGLRSLTATSYTLGGQGVMYRKAKSGWRGKKLLDGDGSFDSEESLSLFDKADIVATNPPFSRYRDFIDVIAEREHLDFILLATNDVLTYKNVFPLFASGRAQGGAQTNLFVAFDMPADYEGNGAVPGVTWMTSLDHGQRRPLELVDDADLDEFERYDNLDAIEVPFLNQIPAEWDGKMGVPITYLSRHDPDLFDLLGVFTAGEQGYDVGSRAVSIPKQKTPWNGPVVGGQPKYKRIVIQRRQSRDN